MEKPSWLKDQTEHEDFEVIECLHTDDYKDFSLDNGCYVLIRILSDEKELSVAICNHSHEILKEFRGKTARDVYSAILTYEKGHDLSWFTKKDHIAYLGKELAKAELAIFHTTDYVQDE